MDTFDPPIKPSPGTGGNWRPRIIRTQFGDGYSQRTEDGLNPVVGQYRLYWELLTPDQYREIVDFLREHVAEAFLWAIPGQDVPLVWTVAQYDDNFADPVRNQTLTATFQQEFDLA